MDSTYAKPKYSGYCNAQDLDALSFFHAKVFKMEPV